jgi:hypothetical protein
MQARSPFETGTSSKTWVSDLCYRVDGIVVAEGALDMGASHGGILLSASNVCMCIRIAVVMSFYPTSSYRFNQGGTRRRRLLFGGQAAHNKVRVLALVLVEPSFKIIGAAVCLQDSCSSDGRRDGNSSPREGGRSHLVD